MTLGEVKNLFYQCDYPFYKALQVQGSCANAILYSMQSDCKKEIVFDVSDPQKALHQLAIQLIKFRSLEMQAER